MSFPDGYTQLEYIESTGTQYIDTGFMPNQDTRVVCDFLIISDNGAHQVAFGVRNASSSGQYVFGYTGHKTPAVFRSDFADSQASFPSDVLGTARHLVDKNKNICAIDAESVTNTAGTFQCDYNLTFFANNTAGAIAEYTTMLLYSAQIYDSASLTRDYIPVETETGDIGLLDLVSGTFYGNAGAGEFSPGPAVALPEISVSHVSSTKDSVTIAWNAVDGASGYRIYRDFALLGSVTALTYTDTAPTAYANHIYAVVAYGTSGAIAVGSVTGASIWPSGLPPLVVDRGPGTYYCAIDLNRVGTAVKYLAGRLLAFGYSVQVAPKTDWLMSDWPKAFQLEQYRADIVTLRDALTAPPTMPQVPDSIRYMEYTDANDIEAILVQLEQMLDNMAAAWFYTGDLYTGEI